MKHRRKGIIIVRKGLDMPEKEISSIEKNDIRTLLRFVEIYCREHHDGDKTLFTFKRLDIRDFSRKDVMLCPECRKLLTYGLSMRLRCPHDPKPMCKKCESQCYKGEYKREIGQIMKFSGMYLVKHGRIDLLFHYFR